MSCIIYENGATLNTCRIVTHMKLGDLVRLGTIIGIITGFIILLLLFIFSVIAWELYRRDYK